MIPVKNALRNVDIVVASVQMKREEHTALMESIAVISTRCQQADKLEKKVKELEKENKALKRKK